MQGHCERCSAELPHTKEALARCELEIKECTCKITHGEDKEFKTITITICKACQSKNIFKG